MNLAELFFETVLDFNADKRFYDALDNKIEKYNAAENKQQRNAALNPSTTRDSPPSTVFSDPVRAAVLAWLAGIGALLANARRIERQLVDAPAIPELVVRHLTARHPALRPDGRPPLTEQREIGVEQPLRRACLEPPDQHRLRVGGADQTPAIPEQHPRAVHIDHLPRPGEVLHGSPDDPELLLLRRGVPQLRRGMEGRETLQATGERLLHPG